MKTVGIIGGLGPETTTKFYMDIVLACSKISGCRPNVVISNVELPLLLEKEILEEGKNEKSILPYIIRSAKQLEKADVQFIVIPCNTVHIFIKQIRSAVSIPVLSIIEETSKVLVKKEINEIGLLATPLTISSKLFDEKLKLSGIKIKTPNKLNINKVGTIIRRIVDKSSANEDSEEFLKIMKELKTNNYLLACTDLQLINNQLENAETFDTLDILAKATVREIFS